MVTGTPFSVSAAVGFISIFAIAIMDGILLNFYIHQLWEAGHSVVDSIVMGADRRFRALMMTALVDGLGLLACRAFDAHRSADSATAGDRRYRWGYLDRAVDPGVPTDSGVSSAQPDRDDRSPPCSLRCGFWYSARLRTTRSEWLRP